MGGLLSGHLRSSGARAPESMFTNCLMRTSILQRAAVLFLLALPWCGWAQFSFKTNANNTITITGYTNSPGATNITLNFPSAINGLPVTTIGTNAFFNNTKIVVADFPNSITNIDDYAFDGCSFLRATGFVPGLARIGFRAFAGCPITNVDYPSTLKRIEQGAFIGNKVLARVGFPNTVEEVGAFAFSGCTALVSVTVQAKAGDGHTGIGDYAFEGCISLSELSLGNGVYHIGNSAFFNCKNLSDLTLVGGTIIGHIGLQAFMRTGLTNLAIELHTGQSNIAQSRHASGNSTPFLTDSGCNIDDHAFQECTNLATVSITGNVTNIGIFAFYGCTKLRDVTLPSGLGSLNSYLFQGCVNVTNVSVGTNVQSIGDLAFYDCHALKDFFDACRRHEHWHSRLLRMFESHECDPAG